MQERLSQEKTPKRDDMQLFSGLITPNMIPTTHQTQNSCGTHPMRDDDAESSCSYSLSRTKHLQSARQ